MLVKVVCTKEHISAGQQGPKSGFFRCKVCPVALAIRDVLSFSVNVTVTGDGVMLQSLLRPFTKVCIALPDHVWKRIANFDDFGNREANPTDYSEFSFDLEVPDEFVRKN